jgi:hypothetical protein
VLRYESCFVRSIPCFPIVSSLVVLLSSPLGCILAGIIFSFLVFKKIPSRIKTPTEHG